MNREQEYRINVSLRRRGQAALDSHFVEFKSEDFDDDESYCAAIASEVMDMLSADRWYLEGQDE